LQQLHGFVLRISESLLHHMMQHASRFVDEKIVANQEKLVACQGPLEEVRPVAIWRCCACSRSWQAAPMVEAQCCRFAPCVLSFGIPDDAAKQQEDCVDGSTVAGTSTDREDSASCGSPRSARTLEVAADSPHSLDDSIQGICCDLGPR